MQKLEDLSLTDQISLLRYVEKNYHRLKTTWSAYRVEYLRTLIDDKVRDVGFMIKDA